MNSLNFGMVANDKIDVLNFAGEVDSGYESGNNYHNQHNEEEQNNSGITLTEHQLDRVA